MPVKPTIPAEITRAHDLITSRITALETTRQAAATAEPSEDPWAGGHDSGRIAGLNEALSLVFHALVETARPA